VIEYLVGCFCFALYFLFLNPFYVCLDIKCPLLKKEKRKKNEKWKKNENGLVELGTQNPNLGRRFVTSIRVGLHEATLNSEKFCFKIDNLPMNIPLEYQRNKQHLSLLKFKSVFEHSRQAIENRTF